MAERVGSSAAARAARTSSFSRSMGFCFRLTLSHSLLGFLTIPLVRAEQLQHVEQGLICATDDQGAAPHGELDVDHSSTPRSTSSCSTRSTALAAAAETSADSPIPNATERASMSSTVRSVGNSVPNILRPA